MTDSIGQRKQFRVRLLLGYSQNRRDKKKTKNKKH